MKVLRITAITFLVAVWLTCALSEIVAPASYAQQFRELPDSAPTRRHLLGTDDLGRDRFSRLLYGTRISLTMATAAAFFATLLAAFIGASAGFVGGWFDRCIVAAIDLFLSLPWLFLLITVRAILPLNTSPRASAIITFALVGSLGWGAAARVICSDARAIVNSDFIVLARASGNGGLRLLRKHVLPNLKPAIYAQFWISIPLFILAEANLGILGLGVGEPLPSWGGLLRELESLTSATSEPWRFVPLVLFILVVSSFHFAMHKKEVSA